MAWQISNRYDSYRHVIVTGLKVVDINDLVHFIGILQVTDTIWLLHWGQHDEIWWFWVCKYSRRQSLDEGSSSGPLLQNWLDIRYACVRWGGSLSYWYLVLCYSWCELGRLVIASFVCNLIYLYGCFDSKIKIIRLWLLSVWCYFGCPCLMMPYYC